ncbi:MAG TPA: hypothetical protein VFO89_13795, partial [Thermoanaerobaculia bacterium]|nr:hypothetical protein [Thermoanaerobaculia bacterium]
MPPLGSFPLFLPDALALLERVTRKPPLPSNLYHYTTADGLRGILTHGHIWATNVRYMNDRSELTYAREVVFDELNRAVASCDHPVKTWLAEFRPTL